METTPAHHPLPPPLNVDVRVEKTHHGVRIHCHPKHLPVPRDKTYVVLQFNLLNRDFMFPATDAVMVTGPDPAFPLVSWTEGGGRVAKLFDFNTDRGEHTYTVSVMPRAVYRQNAKIINGAPSLE